MCQAELSLVRVAIATHGIGLRRSLTPQGSNCRKTDKPQPLLNGLLWQFALVQTLTLRWADGKFQRARFLKLTE